MRSLAKQIQAVLQMSLMSLPQRLWMALATLLAIAIVVAVLLAFLSMGNGFKATIANSGAEDVAIFLREGSQAEINSVLDRDQVSLIEEAPGIAQQDGRALVSGEMYVIVDGKKRNSDTDANIPLRGLSVQGLALRENVSLAAGRMFTPGKNEIVVGQSVVDQYQGFDIGNTVKLGNNEWQVVGVFDAPGSVFASELWADVRVLQSQFNRGSSVQIVRAKLADGASLAAIEDYITGDARLNLEVKTESDYYGEQAKTTTGVIFYLGWPLAIAMAIGALAGALNTMYTSVAQRTPEIATLRAMGFSGLATFFGVMAESIAIALCGGLLGALAAFIFFDGMTASTLGSSFSQIVFDFQLDGAAFGDALQLALLVGLIGGLFPAIRAARLPVVAAFSAAEQ